MSVHKMSPMKPIWRKKKEAQTFSPAGGYAFGEATLPVNDQGKRFDPYIHHNRRLALK